MRRVGFCYHPDLPGARSLAERLAHLADGRVDETWLAAVAWDEVGVALADQVPGSDLLVCVGGDGTVLHVSGFAAREGIPIFGVRLGRLGFLTECTEAEAEQMLLRVLDGEGHVEHRALVQAQVNEDEPVHALNDVIIGRRSLGRTVSVGVRIDGVLIAEYRADAVIIASATGSTGYALSVGGPILYPTSRDIVLVPVAPHLSRANALVLAGESRIELEVARGFEAVMTVDGQAGRSLSSGTTVHLSSSPRVVQFIRLGAENQFYANIADRLGWLRRDHVLDKDDDAPA